MDSAERSNPARDAIAWFPSPDNLNSSRLGTFMRCHGIASYQELLRRALDPEWFWRAVVDDLALEWYRPYTAVLDLSRGKPWATWFTGGLFNWVHNGLDRYAHSSQGDKMALIWEGDGGQVRRFTYLDLWRQTNRLANALRALGVHKGDRVGIYLPMIPESAIAVLACGKVGAIFTPIFSGYGAGAVASRLQDCEARFLITADGFFRRGSEVPMKQVADAAVAQSHSVERVVVCRHSGGTVDMVGGRDVWLHELVEGQSEECDTERTAAEDPYMIIYTSGTTGRPKGAVHVHCGFPIKGAQDLAHCFDVRESDTVFWHTDLGWMMGPWVISGTLMLGATLVMYEGTPDYPGPDRLWSMVQRHGITVLGLSPAVIRALKPHGVDAVRSHDLASLRVLGSTGEVWDPESWQWFFANAGGGRCPIINYSGGTEVSGGILGCTPLTPLKPCSFSGPVPGMAADVVDESGNSVRGAVGELVVRNVWPGMTRGFWRDPDRYVATYWSRLPDTWVHGDWAEIDADGFWFIRGRSDDTIKVAGKRLGPAEVEAAALAHPSVVMAAAVGVPHAMKGEAVALFVVLRDRADETDDVRAAITGLVAVELGKALRPDAVLFVSELPHTRNAKLLRRLIRSRYIGDANLGDLSSLENPSSLDAIAQAH